MSFPLLTLLGAVPLVGALVVMLTPRATGRVTGLFISLLTTALALVVVGLAAGGSDLSEQFTWIPAFGAHWAMNADGISLTMVLLTVLLTPFVLIASWNVGHADAEDGWGPRAFSALVLVMESFALFCFLASDVLVFYIFFEATLIPMYFLIGGFGGTGRRRAAIKFLLFGLGGGLILLAGVVGVYAISAGNGQPTMLLGELAGMPMGTGTERVLFVLFFIAFALKAPMVPFHTWLPDAAESGTPGTSALLVGVLDKIGTFGMIRFCLELFPGASQWAAPVVLILALLSMIYGALAAIGETDILRLIAFTSVSHFGFIVIGIFSFTTVSMTGATFYMFNHAFSTGVLFLAAHFLIQRRGSQKIADYGGVQKLAPVLAGVFLLGGLSSLALPGMSSFVSEFMVIAGSFSQNIWIGGISTLGMVLAATYILLMYQRTMTGPVTEDVEEAFGEERSNDLTGRERWAVAPLLLIIFVFGFFPKPMLDLIEPAVTTTMSQVGVSDPSLTMEGSN